MDNPSGITEFLKCGYRIDCSFIKCGLVVDAVIAGFWSDIYCLS